VKKVDPKKVVVQVPGFEKNNRKTWIPQFSENHIYLTFESKSGHSFKINFQFGPIKTAKEKAFETYMAHYLTLGGEDINKKKPKFIDKNANNSMLKALKSLNK